MIVTITTVNCRKTTLSQRTIFVTAKGNMTVRELDKTTADNAKETTAAVLIMPLEKHTIATTFDSLLKKTVNVNEVEIFLLLVCDYGRSEGFRRKT